jgi:uncharacterized membrane protein YfcA
MTEYLPLWAIVFFGGLVQGLTGFGFVLVALPLVALFLDIRTVIPLVTALAFSICVILAWDLRRHLLVKRLSFLLLGTVPGILTGVWLLKTMPASFLELLVALCLLFFVGNAVLLKPRQRAWGWAGTCAAGFFSGMLGGSIGAGGPPVVVYSAAQPWPKDEIKSTMTSYFVLSGLGILVTQYAGGLYTPGVLRLLLVSSPALLLGVALGRKLYTRISGEGYHRLLMALLFLLGLLMLWRAVGAWMS